MTLDPDVAAKLRAEVRKSGLPFKQIVNAFLRLALNAAAENLAPLPLLSLLKHPLASGGMAPGRFRELSRRLELAALRGPRPAPGLDGLIDAVKDSELKDFAARLGRALSPLISALATDKADLAALIAARASGVIATAMSSTGRSPPISVLRPVSMVSGPASDGIVMVATTSASTLVPAAFAAAASVFVTTAGTSGVTAFGVSGS